MSNTAFTQGPAATSITAGTSSNTPTHSSPESFEVDDEPNPIASPPWQSLHGPTSPGSSTSATRAPPPLQKRRRVTRACDECRRKKIKCDGKQPCTHCTVYSYDCTYDQPSNRRRNPTPQYIEALETRLQRAETLLRTVFPNIDLKDPNAEVAIQKQQEASVKDIPEGSQSGDGSKITDHGAQLRSMIESTGQLDIDESGNLDFHGGSSGAVFVRRMREQFGDLLGDDHGGPFLPKLPRTKTIGPIYDSPRSSSIESPLEAGMPNTIDLPSREAAKVLCQNSLNSACALLRFVHQPTFYKMFNRIYDVPPENFGDEENRFLPLLYVVLALGCMFNRPATGDGHDGSNYQTSISEGLKYFKLSRQMMDITECRDITSVQAIIFMILFLQCTANLSTCYSYIGIALRSSLRMGLHRNLAAHFNPIERETRRRLFWIIRKMDTYVSALLGFPQMLSDDDIDQEFPIEVDDEFITEEAILSMPPGRTSLYAASNAHTRLMFILAKVIKYVYPTKGLEQSVQGGTKNGNAKGSYLVSHSQIREIERDLAEWLDKLPMALRPGGEGTVDVLRVQQLLRLAYAHVQMTLYRPFLHYVSQKTCSGKTIDERSYACAAACISVSRNIVHITTEMKRRGLLIGTYWFTMYTTFFAILALVFFVLENPDKPGSQEILADAIDGNDALKGLAKTSQAADRCSMALSTLFEQLPERLTTARSGPVMAKNKRPAPSPNRAASQSSRGVPDLPPLEPVGLNQRATTFPVARSIYDSNSRFRANTVSNPNLRESFQDVISPTDLSFASTPTSSATDPNARPLEFNIPQAFGPADGFPDLSAMMFPSGDPFAYPNQPMTEFENIKHENVADVQNSPAAAMFLSNGASGSGIYDDLEGQLFGPIPPYLMQGQQFFDASGQIGTENNILSGLGHQQINYDYTSNVDVSFDGILAGGNNNWTGLGLNQQRKS